MHLLAHHPPATNGAPQVTAVGFASVIFFMLAFPFVEYASAGVTYPDLLIHMIQGANRTGFNLFALALFLVPFIGIAVAVTARSAWRFGTMLVALAGFVLIPITIAVLGQDMRATTQGTVVILPGLGSYMLMFGYGVITLAAAIAAFRARHDVVDDRVKRG